MVVLLLMLLMAESTGPDPTPTPKPSMVTGRRVHKPATAVKPASTATPAPTAAPVGATNLNSSRSQTDSVAPKATPSKQ